MSDRRIPDDNQPFYLKINSTCNQRCVFCRYYSDVSETEPDPDYIVSGLNSLRNDKLLTTVTFTGGEPTINPHLINYIRAARGFGFQTIGIETNGLMLSYQKYSASLVEAGLTHARITMISHNASDSDGISRVHGGFELTDLGISRAIRHGLNTIIQIPLLSSTIGSLPEHVSYISEKHPGIRGIELRMLDHETAAHADIPIELLEIQLKNSRKELPAGIKFAFRASHGPAPCLFSEPESLASIFNLPAADETEKPNYPKIDSCDSCLISCVCPGVHPTYMRDTPGNKAHVISPQLARKLLRPGPGRNRLPIIDQRKQGEANFCTYSMSSDAEGNSFIREAMLRINYSCNQRCLFCWIEPGYDNLPHEAIVDKISDFKSHKLKTVSITGGEPTLNPNLPGYIKMIREAGVEEICLQTNAMLINGKGLAGELIEAGLNSAFVSLHSHIPEISDLITGVEGGFEKTVGGIENLVRSGAIVFISHVINSFNYEHLVGFVEFTASSFKKVPIIFSYAAPIYGAIMHRGLIPQLNRIRAPLIAALERCYELKVPFSGLSGMCGIPPCILDGNLKYYPDINRVAPGDGGEDMLKTDCCESCSLNDFCFGIRKNYADIYGTEELHAVFVENVKPTVLDYVKPEDFFNQMIS